DRVRCLLSKREAGQGEYCERRIDNIGYCFHVFISFHCFGLLCPLALRSPFLAVHRCTVRILARGYPESWLGRVESLKPLKRKSGTERITRMPQICETTKTEGTRRALTPSLQRSIFKGRRQQTLR